MKDIDHMNSAIQEILKFQDSGQINCLFNNLMASQEQNISQILTNAILEPLVKPHEIKISGKYIADSQGNEVALYERIEGRRINAQGITEEIDKEYFYTMDDGSTLGEFVECINCGSKINKNSLSLCPTCSRPVCPMCGTSSQSGKLYCGWWHRFLNRDGLL